MMESNSNQTTPSCCHLTYISRTLADQCSSYVSYMPHIFLIPHMQCFIYMFKPAFLFISIPISLQACNVQSAFLFHVHFSEMKFAKISIYLFENIFNKVGNFFNCTCLLSMCGFAIDVEGGGRDNRLLITVAWHRGMSLVVS